MSAAVDHYAARFEPFAERVTTGDPEWLQRRRAEALECFVDVGFPSSKLEAWRHTNLSALEKTRFEPAEPERSVISRAQIEAISFPVFACSLFVFVDGRFEPELSTPQTRAAGLPFESLARLRSHAPDRLAEQLARQANGAEHPFAALNTAFLDDGAVIWVPEGHVEEEPLHLVFVSSAGDCPRLTHPRVLIVAEAQSCVTVVQDHVSIGEGARFTNAVCEVTVGPNAAVDLVLLQRESDATHHVSNLQVQQARDSRFHAHTLTFGGELVRNDLSTRLGGEGAEAGLRGLFLGAGTQLIDNHTSVDHAVAHCTSRELYKGILSGESRGVFRGRVIVRPDAQKTDAHQSSLNLLLSDGAEIDTKPQLEIHADDVKCSHGAAIGQLDADALFYLCTRGIEDRAARDLLTRAFASEITERLPAAALGETIGELLLDRLHAEQRQGASS